MAGPQDPQECLVIPTIKAGEQDLGTVNSCSGNLFHDSYVSMAPKVAKLSTIDTTGLPDSGSAFFVQDGTHMVTNAHVVLGTSEIHVNYQDKQYAAVVEKLDDINDLAEIKVIGLDADPSRSQKLGPVALMTNEHVMGVGVPGTSGQIKYLSPGALWGSNKYYNILNDPKIQDPEAAHIRQAYNSGDPVLQQLAQQVANSPRLVVNQGARPGNSGSPDDDAAGNLVGVITAVNGNNATVDVPFTKVQDLVNNPESVFDMHYSTVNRLVGPSLGAGLEDTAGVGAVVTGLLGKGRLVPLAYAGVRAVSLISEMKDLAKSSDANQSHDLKVSIGEDLAMVAGGVAATALWRSPGGRVAGLGLMGLSLASRFVNDSQEKHYVLTGITRKNGDTHAPWAPLQQTQYPNANGYTNP